MQFRKKPVVIDAFRVERCEIPDWMLAALDNGKAFYDHRGRLTIRTLEGEMVARPGDWIIQGIKGELYPCKPDIFKATYEPVENGE